MLVIDALDRSLVRFALDQGISGLLLTDMPARDIEACLHQVAGGRSVLPAGWQSVLAFNDDPLESLSGRQLVAQGCSYEEVGSRLFISTNTVKFHVRSIYLRLGVRNRMAAARILESDSAPLTSALTAAGLALPDEDEPNGEPAAGGPLSAKAVAPRSSLATRPG